MAKKVKVSENVTLVGRNTKASKERMKGLASEAARKKSQSSARAAKADAKASARALKASGKPTKTAAQKATQSGKAKAEVKQANRSTARAMASGRAKNTPPAQRTPAQKLAARRMPRTGGLYAGRGGAASFSDLNR